MSTALLLSSLKPLFSREGKLLRKLWKLAGSKVIGMAIELMLAVKPVTTIDICVSLIEAQIKSTKHKEVLLREDDTATAIISSILKTSFQGPAIALMFTQWLESITIIPRSTFDFENIQSENEKLLKQQKLETIFRMLVFQLKTLKNAFPPLICYMFEKIRSTIEEIFDHEAAVHALCSLFFLRFFCAILTNCDRSFSSLSPHEWNLPTQFTPLADGVRKKLIVISKLLSLLSTRMELDPDNPLSSMNSVLQDHTLYGCITELILETCKRGSSFTKISSKLPIRLEQSRIRDTMSCFLGELTRLKTKSKLIKTLTSNLQSFEKDQMIINYKSDVPVFREIECVISTHIFISVDEIWKRFIRKNHVQLSKLSAENYSKKKQQSTSSSSSSNSNNNNNLVYEYIYEKLTSTIQFIIYNPIYDHYKHQIDDFGDISASLNIRYTSELWEIASIYKQSIKQLFPEISTFPLLEQSFHILIDYIIHNSVQSFSQNQIKTADISLVKRSWEIFLSRMGTSVGEEFYKILFAKAPSIIPLFEKTNMETQTKHLFSVLTTVIEGCHGFDNMQKSLFNMGRKHITFKVKVEYYSLVIDVLLALLANTLKGEWNDSLERSWKGLFKRVSTLILIAQLNIEKPLEIEKLFQTAVLNNCSLLSSQDAGSQVLDSQLATAISTGTYKHSFRLLEIGARLAWRESKVDPLKGKTWNTVEVVDARESITPNMIFEALSEIAVQHLSTSNPTSPRGLSNSSELQPPSNIGGFARKKTSTDKSSSSSLFSLISSDKKKKKKAAQSSSSSSSSPSPNINEIPFTSPKHLSTSNHFIVFNATSFGGNKYENRGIRFWNRSFVSYAAYECDTLPPKFEALEGNILGDRSNLELTKVLIQNGWQPPKPEDRTAFDILPLCIEWYNHHADISSISLIAVPSYYHISLKHPTSKSFNKLNLHWKCSEMKLDYLCNIGGLNYSALALSFPNVAEEIVSILLDDKRFGLTNVICQALGINQKSEKLWREKVKYEVYTAVLHSFETHNLKLITNETISEFEELYLQQFDFLQNLQNNVWTLPSLSSPSFLSNSNPPPSSSPLPPLQSSQSTDVEYYTTNNNNDSYIPQLVKLVSSPWRSHIVPPCRSSDQMITTKSPILILYASERGSTERFARALYLSLPKDIAQITSMDNFIGQYPITKLVEFTVIIFVVSTFINGAPPSNATKFFQNLQEICQIQHSSEHSKSTSLNNHNNNNNNNSVPPSSSSGEDIIRLLPIRYAIFGWGAKTFKESFCAFNRNLEQSLKQLGGKELIQTYEGNVLSGGEQVWNVWYDILFSRLADVIPNFSNKIKQSEMNVSNEPDLSINSSRNNIQTTEMNMLDSADLFSLVCHKPKSSDSFEENDSSHSDDNSFAAQFDEKPESIILERRLLREEDRSRNQSAIYQLDISSNLISYLEFPLSAGDHVAILPENTNEDVEWLASYIRIPLDEEVIHSKLTSTMTVREILSIMDFQIRRPHSILFNLFAKNCKNDEDKKDLHSFAEMSFEDVPFFSVIELLKQYQINCSLSMLLSILPAFTQPRYFDISNSPLIDNFVRIIYCDQIIDFPKKYSTNRYTTTTHYLTSAPIGQPLKLFFRNSFFHSPAISFMPIIICAEGTSISSILGFLNERLEKLKRGISIGDCILIYSCRNNEDYAWCEPYLQKARDSSIISELIVTFFDSNANSLESVLEANSEKICTFLYQKSGYFMYSGGGITEIAVRNCLVNAIKLYKNVSQNEAFDLFVQLSNSFKYSANIWGFGSLNDNRLQSSLNNQASNWIKSVSSEANISVPKNNNNVQN